MRRSTTEQNRDVTLAELLWGIALIFIAFAVAVLVWSSIVASLNLRAAVPPAEASVLEALDGIDSPSRSDFARLASL
jgi:hypothetical protein